MRKNFHQRNPPIRIMTKPKIRLMLNPLADGASVSAISGVPVDSGAMDGLGEGVIGMGLGVCVGAVVAVAGGVTRRRNFCSGRITDVEFSPFQVIRSESETSYSPAIQKSVSPLWTIW